MKILFTKILFLFFLCTNGYGITKKIEEGANVNHEIEDMFDDFALLKDASLKNDNHANKLQNQVKSPPFIWPVEKASIKKIVLYARNYLTFELNKNSKVFSPHTGIIISVHDKAIVIKHIVEGGTCYISILKNINNITVKEGDIIKAGHVLGESDILIFELKQMDVKIRPSFDMLFPPLDFQLIRVVQIINKPKF